MIEIFVINERTLWRFLWLAITGRRPCVIEVQPVVAGLGRFLRPIVARLIKGGRAAEAFDLAPSLGPVRALGVISMIHDIFARTEGWQRNHYAFARIDRDIPDYAMACKLVVSNYVHEAQIPVLLIDAIDRTNDNGAFSLHGGTPTIRGIFEAYYGRPCPGPPRRHSRPILANRLLAVMVCAAAFIWIARHIRLRSPETERYFLAVDDNSGPMNLISEVADGGAIAMVARTKNTPLPVSLRGRYTRFMQGDGVLGFRDALPAIALVVRDVRRILRCNADLEPQLFWRMAVLPFRRIVIRALLARLRPTFYWGRDPYSPDHILRRQELHRIGAESHSILHGFGALADLYPMFRYISFDRFYVFGRVIHRIYQDTWATDMKVVVGGSFSFTREEFAQLRNAPRHGRDIAVFTNVMSVANDAVFVDFVRALGHAFPDRRILLQAKLAVRRMPSTVRFLKAATEGLTNVEIVDWPLARIMAEARYAFSDPSTIVMEAIQLDIPAFTVDLWADHQTCFYRQYPWLCVRSGGEAIRRVRDIESGDWSYPFDECDDLTHRSSGLIYDFIREGFRLQPRPTGSNENRSGAGGMLEATDAR